MRYQQHSFILLITSPLLHRLSRNIYRPIYYNYLTISQIIPSPRNTSIRQRPRSGSISLYNRQKAPFARASGPKSVFELFRHLKARCRYFMNSGHGFCQDALIHRIKRRETATFSDSDKEVCSFLCYVFSFSKGCFRGFFLVQIGLGMNTAKGSTQYMKIPDVPPLIYDS